MLSVGDFLAGTTVIDQTVINELDTARYLFGDVFLPSEYPQYDDYTFLTNEQFREFVANDDETQWITVGGAHIPIGKGESKDAAVKAHLERIKSGTAGKGDKQTTKDLKQISAGAHGKGSSIGRGSSATDEGQKHEGEGEHGDKPNALGMSAAGRARLSQLGATDSHSTAMKDVNSAIASVKQVAGQATSLKAALGQKVWDKMTPGQQAGYTALKNGVDKVEHVLEKGYHAGQNAAKEVMRAQGMNEHHIETAGKLLGAVDGVARWSVNIPVAHEAIHALTHIGGPVAFLGAKVGYYTPVASLAYVGASLAKAAVGDVGRAAGRLIGRKDPYQTIKVARAAVRGAMAKQEHHGKEHSLEGHLAHGVAGAVHLVHPGAGLAAEGAVHAMSHNTLNAKGDMGTPDLAAMKRNAPKIAKYVKDHDNDDDAIAHLYAAIDECQGDVDKAIKYANAALEAA